MTRYDDVTGNRYLNWAARASGKCSPIQVNGSFAVVYFPCVAPLQSETKTLRCFLFIDKSWDYFPAKFHGSKAKILWHSALKVRNIPGKEVTSQKIGLAGSDPVKIVC